MRHPFFKGDQGAGEVMKAEEKAEVEKKQDSKEGRKENIKVISGNMPI